jgi:prolyl-tRNA synthetase
MVMGCYGIGVTRTLQAVIEQNHDANGIIWPVSVAPAHVSLLVLNAKHTASMDEGRRLASALEDCGLEVLMDDRDERPGVKLKDADLLGLPARVVVSERSLGSSSVELRMRSEPQSTLVPLTEAVKRVSDSIKSTDRRAP